MLGGGPLSGLVVRPICPDDELRLVRTSQRLSRETIYHRFFSQQFKRSCVPDGPKVGTVSLSPRGDWRMPSDAGAAAWLASVAAAEGGTGPGRV